MRYAKRDSAASKKYRLGGVAFALSLSCAGSAFAEGAAKPAPVAAAPAAAPAPAPAATPVGGTATPAVVTEPAAPTAAAAATPVPDAPAPTAFAPLKIESPSATLKLGLLAQPQYEAIGTPIKGESGVAQNLFLRRIRLLVGGTLFDRFEYFFDTDSPNLFKANAEGVKGGSQAMNVQDAFVTYKAYQDYFKVDAGYMLPPGAHNALQGAGTLLGLDYFANSFPHANVFNSAGSVGRDTGVQLRGIVADGRLEYRAGIFQGLRDPQNAGMTELQAHNFFRMAARVQFNVFDPETAFFYAGTYLGKKRVLSFGAAYDTQFSYHHWALDGFLDMPLGPGALTAQVNVAKWNGNEFVGLANQYELMAEAGYLFPDAQVSPIVRVEYRTNPDAAASTHEERYGLGAAYWPYGHNVNLKAFYTRIQPTPNLNGYDQFQVQWQLYFY